MNYVAGQRATEIMNGFRWRWALALLAAGIWFALVVGRALTREPFIDEALYSLPAWNLSHNGSMGSPVIETVGSPNPGWSISPAGIRKHTYWMMPLPTVFLAGWYRLVGFSLFTTRMFTAVCMLAMLAAWYAILWRVSGDRTLSALGVLLIASDAVLLTRAAFGRMDVLSAAFGFSALAAYLNLRERSLGAAVAASQTLVVLAGLSHPNGGIVCGCGMLAVTLAFDARRLRWRHLAYAAVPYAAGAAAMGAYILQDRAAFMAQFFSQVGGRFDGLRSPLAALRREPLRYAEAFGFGQTSRAKILICAAYLLAAARVCWDRPLRRKYGALLVFAGAVVTSLALFEHLKVPHYLVYTLPMFAAFVAIAVRAVPAGRWRSIAHAAAAVLICVQAGSVLRLIVAFNSYSAYVSAIRWIHSNVPRQALIMGDSSLYFDLGTTQLVDDIRLGYLTGKKADVVIVDGRYLDVFNYLRRDEPDAWRYIDHYLRDECRAIPLSAGYTAYVPRTSLVRAP